MKSLKAQGISILWVTHRLEELVGRADCATVFRDGRYVGTIDVDPSGDNIDALVKMMIGREIASHEELLAREVQAREVNESAECVLSVEGLSRGKKLREISLKLRRGEVVGVAGMAGSGRTELVRAIMGADKRDAGRLELNGKVMKMRSPREAYRAGMSLVPEDRKSQGILGDLSVAENISVAALWRLLVGGTFIRKRQEATVAASYQKELDIRTSTMRRPILFLSGGNQQKAILARSLFAESQVMLLDEPTQGIDVAAKLEVYRLINRFVQGGGSALVASSELPELVAVSDRIIVLREGCVAGELKGQVHGTQAEKLALEETIVALATGARGGSGNGHN
jgi:ribose transport system ATP-binding protein